MSACVIAQVCLRIFSHMVMFDCESQFGCVSFHNTAESHSVSIQLTDSEIHTPHRSNVHCHCTYYVKRSMYRKTDKKKGTICNRDCCERTRVGEIFSVLFKSN